MFQKYQHVERFGNQEVKGIELGITHVFPKIDGTNGSVWLEDDIIKTGSRNRELSIENDNAGFCKWVSENNNIAGYLLKHPEHRLYGEWLVPHSLKTYRETAWRQFYIFDITIGIEDNIEYIPYEIYEGYLKEYDLEYIPLICTMKNGSEEQFIKSVQSNTFLIDEGNGLGEGVVIKNYDYYTPFGRQKWAKIVRSEFKETHVKTMGAPVINGDLIEEKIIRETLTEAFVEKEYSKIAIEGWKSQYIPKLLGVVWHEYITEEIWDILKKYKNPRIDFKLLQRFLTARIKEVKKELF